MITKLNRIVMGLLLFAGLSFPTNAQFYQWAKQMGGTGYDEGKFIDIDLAGNLYTIGMFASTVDFDPGLATTTMTATTGNEFYLCKYTNDGSLIWAKQLGMEPVFSGVITSLKVDPSGNIFISGGFNAPLDFDPGPGVYPMTPVGMLDAFIWKLDTDGNFQWAQQFGSEGNNGCYSVKLDASGNVYLSGVYEGTVDFDNGAGLQILFSPFGVQSSFLCKLTSSGTLLWARTVVSSNFTADVAGNVYISSALYSAFTDVDPGPGVTELESSNGSAFVEMLNTNGDLHWAKQFGSGGSIQPMSMTINYNGDIVIAGSFAGVVDVDPGPGTALLTSEAGSLDAFLIILSNTGNHKHTAYVPGTDQMEQSTKVICDASGNIYMKLYYSSFGNYFRKYTSSGSSAWSPNKYLQIDGDFCTDQFSNSYVTGRFDYMAFLPEENIPDFTASGPADIYLGKISDNPPLYIEFLSFNVSPYTGRQVLITWSTAVEMDNDYFTIERSADGTKWESVGTVKGAGTTSQVTSYRFVDEQPLAGYSYYRLGNIDHSKKIEYSEVRSVLVESENSFVAYPNPTTGLLHIEWLKEDMNYSVSLFNPNGTECIKTSYQSSADNSVIDLSSLEKGVYYLKVQTSHHSVIRKIVIE